MKPFSLMLVVLEWLDWIIFARLVKTVSSRRFHYCSRRMTSLSICQTSISAIAHKPPDACAHRAVLSRAAFCKCVRFIGLIFRLLGYLHYTHLIPPTRGVPSCYRVHIWYEETRMAGLQSGEGRMMIDSVVLTQYINVTDKHTDKHTDSHVALANAAPSHCVGRQKLIDFLRNQNDRPVT